MISRNDDARLEAVIHEYVLRKTGVVEDDEPTPLSHARYVAAIRAEFTPEERRMIRAALGLGEQT